MLTHIYMRRQSKQFAWRIYMLRLRAYPSSWLCRLGIWKQQILIWRKFSILLLIHFWEKMMQFINASHIWVLADWLFALFQPLNFGDLIQSYLLTVILVLFRTEREKYCVVRFNLVWNVMNLIVKRLEVFVEIYSTLKLCRTLFLFLCRFYAHNTAFQTVMAAVVKQFFTYFHWL